MRRVRLLAGVAAGALMLGVVACTSVIAGSGSIAADVTGVTTPSDSVEPTPTETQTESPTPSPTPPAPTVNPIEVKRRSTCLLVLATVRTTNNKFNAGKTRSAQVAALQSGISGMRAQLRRSGLPPSDSIYRGAAAIGLELRKLVASAQAGRNPSTDPYNQATRRFTTQCARL